MNKRIITILLCTILLGTNVACQSGNIVSTETQQQSEDSKADSKTGEQTALTYMKRINKQKPSVSEDNYRTWYEVFVYSFYDSDGDGIGDLKGVNEKLDYIIDGDLDSDTDLGCDGIWLMPIMPSATYHKYDVIDYKAIDAEYGSMEDFEILLENCHQRGVHVILDIVMNHTSSQHEWFRTAAEYLKSLPENEEPDVDECPYVKYYNFSKENGNGYCELSGTDWYYEAQFWSEMPDLNLGNEKVRQEFQDIVDFWLDKGVDGFRLDAAKEYYSGSVDANIEVLKWFNTMVKEKKEDAYLVAEVWTDMPTYAKYYESGIDSCFDFAFADGTGVIANVAKGVSSPSLYGTSLENLQESIMDYSDTAIDAPFYSNHDMARSAGYYSGEYSQNQTKIAQAMHLFMTGSAFLYYGEEIGMKGSGKDENKRAPMYWLTDAGAAGMCKGPADMDEITMKYGSVEEQQQDGNSIYYFVQEAIKLRKSFPEISHGTVDYEEVLSDDNLCVLRKTYENSEVMIIFNLSAESQTIDLRTETVNGAAITGESLRGVLLTTAEEAVLEDGGWKLPPYSVIILQ